MSQGMFSARKLCLVVPNLWLNRATLFSYIGSHNNSYGFADFLKLIMVTYDRPTRRRMVAYGFSDFLQANYSHI